VLKGLGVCTTYSEYMEDAGTCYQMSYRAVLSRLQYCNLVTYLGFASVEPMKESVIHYAIMSTLHQLYGLTEPDGVSGW